MNNSLHLLIPFLLSGAVLLGVLIASWAVAFAIGRKVSIPADASRFEVERRAALESDSIVYRTLQVLVYDLVGYCRDWYGKQRLLAIKKSLTFCGEGAPWTAEEFLATKHLEGMIAGTVVGLVFSIQLGFIAGVGIAISIAFAYPIVVLAALADKASAKVRSIKLRLPFVVDLMALMLESEANFRDCLKTAVRENSDHPLGQELAVVDHEIELGRPRADALRTFQMRMGDDDDVRELVFAIIKGEELGTPLAEVLRNQADQMRLKRSQWGEKAAAEAQVKMSFPGMLIMVACIIVVMAPIILAAVSAFGNM